MGLYITDGDASEPPSNPVLDSMVLTVADIGVLVAGVGASLTNFVWDQMVPSAHWVIQHNLGRFPPVAVVDSTGEVVIGFVTYISANQITVDFQSAFSGKAFM